MALYPLFLVIVVDLTHIYLDPATFDQVKTAIEHEGLPTCNSKITIGMLQFVRTSSISNRVIERTFRYAFNKSRIDPDEQKAWEGYRATL